ncbi:MAG: mannose-1-phosphate guanylyltransferase/mannose-6-phosphate isomerase [Pseudomonadota bacterium]
MKLIPVIISGGVGSRLWPVSRETHPKPFMELPGGDNLIHKTFLRAASLDGVEDIVTVTNQDLYFKTDDEYRSVDVGAKKINLHYILEPFGRNTSAAVAAAALYIQERHGPDALMLVMAADHLIQDDQAFSDAVKNACQVAKQDWLVTFGIEPQYPETGFGYIEANKSKEVNESYEVERFVEKPHYEKAREYIDAGNYYWNSGIFCFSVKTLIDELGRHASEVLELVAKSLMAGKTTKGEGQECVRLDRVVFDKVNNISIDFALMERSSRVAVIPCDIGWSDIGSWNAVSELIKADENGNRCEGEVLLHDSNKNFVYSPERLTALVGLENLLVVDTPDALLVAHKDNAQDVKYIVKKLKESKHETHLLHRTVHRPWGTYTTLEEGERFKIKRIEVKPGASLSLQMHHHRSEHWVVVSGMARVVNDEDEFYLNTNESTFIRASHNHRLENPGVIKLVLIEVQSGDYLGEDDIVRFEDTYGRVGS